jgi:ATP-dependent helicase/nuclease subunit B
MITFLEEIVQAILEKHKDLSSLVLILPSKRAVGFLKNNLRLNNTKTQFSPKIISIEEFIEELSDLQIIDSTELLFKLYDAYLRTDSISVKENFENFSSWATTLLSDFNEIDRHLIEPKPFFTYLSDIQDLNHWYLQNEKTDLIKQYLNFWKNLLPLYQNFKDTLISEEIGYQGLVYREAAEGIEHYLSNYGQNEHIFIGFNALNKAEQTIFQELLETGNTDIYWDADMHFYDDKNHNASLFIRNYVKNWKYYQVNKLKYISDHFKQKKKLNVIEAQKNIGQVKFLGDIISNYSQEQINNTAIVLADENLLLPVLHSLPLNVEQLNITMGLPLKTFPIAQFFINLLDLQQQQSQSLYYKNIESILNHPLASLFLASSKRIIGQITQNNITHLSIDQLCDLAEESEKNTLQLLFKSWENKSEIAIKNCLKIIAKVQLSLKENTIDYIVLFHLHQLFEKINTLNERYVYLKTIKTTYKLLTELVAITPLDFKGDAYNGLQIMGVLETRVLDFENIILLSVNEGVLPSGKSNASFITYDLKQQFGLPVHTEKDAIYAYHFYHLMQRAKEVTFMYSNFSEGLSSGEKSRFLLQLEIENLPNHSIEKTVVAPTISILQQDLKTVTKTPAIMDRLRDIALKGFSPSALTSYIRNPLDFYYQKVLKVTNAQEIEETIAYKTLGTVVHDSLEQLYKPLEGSLLRSEDLNLMKPKIDGLVREEFRKTFKGGNFSKGKNLIIFEVAKRYLSNFIDYELDLLKNGNQIRILKIEQSLKVELSIPELNFPINIGGKVDRVDEFNGQIRIIDYKTGFVKQGDLEIINWGDLTTDEKFSKTFQVLAYALMINNEMPIIQAEAGILSFKNFNSGFLKFATKPNPRGPKNHIINQETLELFVVELKKIILEICNSNHAFIEKENQ